MFDKAEEVQVIAEQLIPQHHPHLADAVDEDLIGYYFRDGNADWAGKAKKCTAFERHITGKILFVFINRDSWNSMGLEQRTALIDHELCHFTRNSFKDYDNEKKEWIITYEDALEPKNWGIRDHDVEEFSEIIKRHGLWETGIEKFAAAVRDADYQMSLDDVDRDKRLKAVK